MKQLSFAFTLTFLTWLCHGQDIRTWEKKGTANWKFTNGIAEANHGSGFLVSPASYTDFSITLEFWVSDDANSGVFIRCADTASVDQTNSYEVNIYDKRPNQKYRTGAIVDIARPLVILNTGNKWNTYEITAKGNHLVVKLNDVVTVDVENSQYTAGPIALQYGAGVVKFRNVKIKTFQVYR